MRHPLRVITAALIVVGYLLATLPNSRAQSNPNTGFTILPSAARSALTVNTADQSNTSWAGASVVINVATPSTGSYTPHIQGKDPVSNLYYDILVGPVLNATATTVLIVYPGVTGSSTASSTVLPRTWRISFVGASTPTIGFSVGGFYHN